MLSDMYLFTVKGDSNEVLHMIRPKTPTPVGWIPAALVLAAVKGSGGHRLYYLCGTNPYRRDEPCSDYPMEVDEIWCQYNPGNLRRTNVCDAAAELLQNNVIAECTMSGDGRINLMSASTDTPESAEKYVVTVTSHSENGDWSASKLCIAGSREEAREAIDEDKRSFVESVGSGYGNELLTEKPDEVWYGPRGKNGRTYAVVAI